MTTSGSTDFSLNARDIVNFALKQLRVKAPGADVSAEDMSDGIESLNFMLKTWQMAGPHLFRKTEGTLSLVANQASYSLSSAYRIVSARFKQSGREIPMEVLTNEEYQDLPLKTTTGIPTTYYFDAQRAGGTLYVWPVLASVTDETIQYTYQRRFEDIDAPDNDLDIPQEWQETVGYSLAARMLTGYGHVDASIRQDIRGMAADLLAVARAADREPVIRFEPARRW